MRSNEDRQVFQEVLAAAARGPFFPDWEFQTLIGFDRSAVEAAATSFSLTIPLTGDLATMLNNCIANLLDYPHGRDSAWSQWVSVTPRELESIFLDWRPSDIET